MDKVKGSLGCSRNFSESGRPSSPHSKESEVSENNLRCQSTQMRRAINLLRTPSNDKKAERLAGDAAGRPDLPPNKPQSTCSSSYVPTKRDIYRHRKQYGVNIGAWFVGERWISHRLYSACDSSKSSELSAVTSHARKYGLERTKSEWESHWDTWIVESDLEYLVSKGINSVRIPIGWFSLSQHELISGTDFEQVEAVYADCWPRILAFIKLCSKYKIGVLIDLHCLPGGANPDSHSGTDSKAAKFLSSSKNRNRGLACVKFIIDQICHVDNVVGLQIINEAPWDTASKCEVYYQSCIEYASSYGNGLPIYISDGWNLEHWSMWVSQRPSHEFIVIDHHYYHCFTQSDHSRSVRDHTRDLIGDEKQLENCTINSRAGQGNIVVGEWSCALNPSSKANFSGPDLRREMQRFGRAQAATYATSKHTGGSWFWTYKFQDRNHENEWDIRDMFELGILPSPIHTNTPLPSRIEQDSMREMMERVRDENYDAHVRYWSSRGSQFEHWRYLDGFNLGIKDAFAFCAFDSSSIGFLSRWMTRRVQGHLAEKGASRLNCEWEFETGYALAISTFTELFH